MPNYIQPGTPTTSGVAGTEAANRAVSPAVTVMPHVAGAVSGNPLGLAHTSPLPLYSQPGTTAPALLPGQLAGTTLGRSKNGPFEKS